MKRLLLILLLAPLFYFTNAQQNIGINTNNPDSTAILDITSSDKGLLIPRLTSTQRLAISNPANSLMVYDLDESALFHYSTVDSAWILIPNKSQLHWDIKNNNIYNTNNGKIGIGTENPEKNIHIKGDGSENPGIAITNGDSSYSIIIVIDTNDEGIFVEGNDGTNNQTLFSTLANGKFGVGTKTPSDLLHLKPQSGITPQIRISNEDSTYHIIIVIDTNDEGIVVRGDDNSNTRELYSSDKIGRFGVGTNIPRNVLHLHSDTINPSIRLSRQNYPFDYILGFAPNSTNFIIVRDSLNGGMANVLEVDSTGDVTINAENEINLNPGITTGSIELTNGGNSVTIDVDANGNLNSSAAFMTPSSIGTPKSLIDLPIDTQSILNGNVHYSEFKEDLISPSNTSIFNYSIGGDTIHFTESGYYNIAYNLRFEKATFNYTGLDCFLVVNGIINDQTIIGEWMYSNGQTRFYSVNYSRVMFFDAGDVLQLGMQIQTFSANQITQKSSSNFNIFKLADE